MKYHVTGAHKDTAEDVEMLVEAESEDAAAQTVAGMNLMVEKVEPAEKDFATDVQHRFEYHTLRGNFSDLQSLLNKYAKDRWRAMNIHHDPHDDKLVRVVLERIHQVDSDSMY